jgi:hypothetical protein
VAFSCFCQKDKYLLLIILFMFILFYSPNTPAISLLTAHKTGDFLSIFFTTFFTTASYSTASRRMLWSTKYIHIKSTTVYAPRRNCWLPPTPHPQASVPPPPCFWGEGNTRWRERGWESPNSDKGHTLWYSLYVRTLCCDRTQDSCDFSMGSPTL